MADHFHPDRFFGEAELKRLAELMACWRKARDAGVVLPIDEQAELEALVEAELYASAERASSILRDLSQ
jgi:hypothetical protein